MPRSKSETPEAETPESPVETLYPFLVIIKGEDRTIMATDEADLKRRIEKLTAQ